LQLVSLTPEGRIALTLKHGKHTYSELKSETGLSDRWLTIKLEELKSAGFIEKKDRAYSLSVELPVSPYELSSYRRLHAKLIAQDLEQLPSVEAIVLFGGVAQNKAHEYSDIDLIVVLREPSEEARKAVNSQILKLESKYHITIEPLILGEEDFLDNVRSREGGIIYGLAEGYDLLVDKTRSIAQTLRAIVERIRSSHDYLEEPGIWLKAR